MLNKIQKNILKNWSNKMKPYHSITTYYQLKKHFDLKYHGFDEVGIWFRVFNKNKNYWIDTIGFDWWAKDWTKLLVKKERKKLIKQLEERANKLGEN